MGDIDMINVCDPRKQFEFATSTAGTRVKSQYTEYKIMVRLPSSSLKIHILARPPHHQRCCIERTI
jgi:hypothetical protein